MWKTWNGPHSYNPRPANSGNKPMDSIVYFYLLDEQRTQAGHFVFAHTALQAILLD